jgi:protoporphyrinogen oxidase
MIRELPKKSVIVLGAGLSGLTAARKILEDNPDINLEVTVLEGLDRVGGRTKTVDIDGFKFDEGAEFIGKTQSHVIALA